MKLAKVMLVFVMLVGLVLLMSLGGCAPREVKEEAVEEVTPEEVVPEEATEELEEKPTIVFWNTESSPERVERVQALLDSFEKETGIKVIQEPVDWNEVYVKITTAVTAGEEPDISFTLPTLATTVKQLDALLPLDDIVEEIDSKYEYFDPQLVPYYFDGHHWAVPVFGLSHVLWYREDLLKEAGFNGPPKTWGELLEVAGKLTSGERYGIGIPTSKSFYADQVVWDFMATNEAYVFDENGEVIFNSPKTAETFKFYKKLAKYSPPDSTGWTWAEAELAFVTGKVAMFIFPGAFLTRIVRETDFADAVKATLIPMPDGGQYRSLGYPWGILVFKAAEENGKLPAVKEFLDYVMQPEQNATFANLEPGLFLPITKAATEAPYFWENELVSRFRDSMEIQAKALENSIIYGFEYGPHPAAGAVEGSDVISESFQKYLMGEMSAEEAAKWGAEVITELAAEAR